MLLYTSFATHTVLYATYNLMELLYGERLGEKYFCIKMRVTNHVKDVLNIYSAS